jgi:hypothetical protein
MPKKTPGKLNAPSPKAAFDQLPLGKLCVPVKGVFYRLHAFDPGTRAPWPPIFFSRRGSTRFDPVRGTGTLYLGSTLVGVLMEIFDDRWGPLGDSSRSLTQAELDQWWVTLVAMPTVSVFAAHGQNLSKIGTDFQVLSGDHQISRRWALRIMRHPANVGGILYPSRHDGTQRNLALFKRPGLTPSSFDATLQPPAVTHGTGPAKATSPLIFAPATLLRHHPELNVALQELEVAILP